MKSFLSLICWIGLCLSAGFLGSMFTVSSVNTWYQTLNQPSFRPPDSVFAPVWTTLYVMMAFAVWLVWRERERQAVHAAIIFFVVQLILNAAWSALFFGWRRPDLAFAEIIVLWLAILATAGAFNRIKTSAAVLMLPYLAWVTFAAVLNFSIWRMNP